MADDTGTPFVPCQGKAIGPESGNTKEDRQDSGGSLAPLPEEIASTAPGMFETVQPTLHVHRVAT